MSADAVHVLDQLERLTARLDPRSFAVRPHLKERRPASLTMVNKTASVLTESVLTAPNTDGKLRFPGPSPITPIPDVETAADRIERVLAEIGR
ncbi:hypothetical protein ABZV14_29610 [Streptosporangium canum]|uniref:hypothetical protein n=1 Tax=Streptosporangium canum TaxID=324952 RepID=UPI0033B8B392